MTARAMRSLGPAACPAGRAAARAARGEVRAPAARAPAANRPLVRMKFRLETRLCIGHVSLLGSGSAPRPKEVLPSAQLGISLLAPADRERTLGATLQKFGGATRSRTSAEYHKKSTLSPKIDIYQNRGLECSVAILQVASQTSLPAGPPSLTGALERHPSPPHEGLPIIVEEPHFFAVGASSRAIWSRSPFKAAGSWAARSSQRHSMEMAPA